MTEPAETKQESTTYLLKIRSLSKLPLRLDGFVCSQRATSMGP